MFPLTQKFLDLPEIAKHWARDLPQRPSVGEAFQMLLNAFWKGDLWELESGARTEHERFLRILADSQPHPGILVYNNPENLPRVSRPMPDGGVVVDIRNRIYLPRDHAMWTPEVISNALAVLTECKMEDYSEAFALAINGAAVSKEDFAAFCDARGYPRPAFWFGTHTEKKAKSFGGRPSVIRQIEAQMRHRATEGQLAPKLLEEAQALHKWANAHVDKAHQVPTPRSIENALRHEYRKLKRNA